MDDHSNIRQVAQLLQNYLDTPPPTTWGRWTFDPVGTTLHHADAGYHFDVTLCRDSASVLDWVVQVSQKAWATPEDIGHLVRSIDALFRLQAVACGEGRNRAFDPDRGHEGQSLRHSDVQSDGRELTASAPSSDPRHCTVCNRLFAQLCKSCIDCHSATANPANTAPSRRQMPLQAAQWLQDERSSLT